MRVLQPDLFDLFKLVQEPVIAVIVDETVPSTTMQNGMRDLTVGELPPVEFHPLRVLRARPVLCLVVDSL
jgi:hypothetical protein